MSSPRPYQPLRIAQVVVQVHVEASGPAYSVRALAEAMAARGHEVALYVTGDAPDVPQVHVHRFHTLPIAQTALAISPTMRAALVHAATTLDVMHTHSMWMMPNVYPAWASFRGGCPLVTSPRGVFADWALRRSRWKKKLMWNTVQRWTVDVSRCLHATSRKELEEIRAFGIAKPVSVIPNGIDIPRFQLRIPRQPRTLLFLARVHPVKGVDLLLRAWQQLALDFQDWTLRIVGPDEGGHLQVMKQLAQEIGAPRVEFVGPKFGVEKMEEYRRAELYVLPSHTENFGMTILEALAAGVPVVVTQGTPWEGVVQNGCGWWVARHALERTLREAMKLPTDELLERGRRGHQWVEQEFSWGAVAKRMEDTYRWAASVASAPSDLHF